MHLNCLIVHKSRTICSTLLTTIDVVAVLTGFVRLETTICQRSLT
jgi:hypothetical protein